MPPIASLRPLHGGMGQVVREHLVRLYASFKKSSQFEQSRRQALPRAPHEAEGAAACLAKQEALLHDGVALEACMVWELRHAWRGTGISVYPNGCGSLYCVPACPFVPTA